MHFHLAENRKDAERPFAFLATYVPGLAAHGALRHAPLGAALREYAGAGAKAELLKLLEPVSRAGETCDWLKEIVDSGEIFHPLRWTAERGDAAAQRRRRARAGGARRAHASVLAGEPAEPAGGRGDRRRRSPSLVGADNLLDFSVEVTLDGEPLTAEEIGRLVASSDGLALLRGKWVEVDSAKLKAALDRYAEIERLARAEGISFGQAMRLIAGADIYAREAAPAAEAWGEVKAGAWLAETLAACRRPEMLAAALPGKALKATLRPYQEVGARWLGFLTRIGLGACLADDMGLGKTLQVIALLLAGSGGDEPQSEPRRRAGFASRQLGCGNRAFRAIAEVFVAHPAFAPAERLKAPTPSDSLTSDLVVTSYALFSRLDWLVRNALAARRDRRGAGDQEPRGQADARRQGAEGGRAASRSPARRSRTILSDLWSIFDFLNPGLLGSSKAFASFAKGLADRTPPSYARCASSSRPTSSGA